MQPQFALHELDSATYQFATEISYFGVDLKDLIFNQVGSGKYHSVEKLSACGVLVCVHICRFRWLCLNKIGIGCIASFPRRHNPLHSFFVSVCA